MGRRSNADIAAAAAAAASEAARTLQARGQEKASEPQPDQPEGHIEPGRVEKLLANRPSKLAMDDILSRREQPVEEATEPKVEPEVKTEPEVKAETPVETEAPKTVRVKVDGEEFDAPADEVEAAGGITSYQRDKASDNRLRKANETVAESKKMMAQVADWLQKQKTPEKPEPTDDQYIQERIDKIRFGTPEESTVALREIMSRGQQKIDPEAITSQVTAQIEHAAAVKQFDNEFADLVKNPILLNAIVAQRNSKLAQLQGKPVDWTVFYRTIGNEVRSAFGRQSQPATPTDKTPSTPSQGSDKEERKSSIVNLPTAAARAELPKEEKEPTPEEARKQWLADARKARGQG